MIQIKLFTIPLLTAEAECEELNKFLRSVKVVDLKKEIISFDNEAYWAISVVYIYKGNIEPGLASVKQKVDYKNILNEEEFKQFTFLRKIRKQIADEDAVPAYAIFTDSELSEVAKLKEVSLASLKKINGIGVKKMEKYGQKFCELINNTNTNETKGLFD